MEFNTPRLVIAAPSSGSGKTTIATGLMGGFAQRFLVQGFKVGPDYIDPGYHTAATRRPSRNLDSWMLPLPEVKNAFVRAASSANLAIIEGVMGLFDGHDGTSESGSTAEVAKLLHAPVILIIDVGRMARSAAAIVQSCRDFDPELRLAGVICNNVASANHVQLVKEAIESIGLPVVGCIPRTSDLHIPQRHLGLHTAAERSQQTRAFLEAAVSIVTEHVNLDCLQAIANSAPALRINDNQRPISIVNRTRIAVARDEAFCFYYEDNLDSLRAAGADTVFFSPLHDQILPEKISGFYFGGGYPELYADQLAANIPMRHAIRAAIGQRIPTYAECGGLMYLTQAIIDSEEKTHPMIGALPGQTQMQPKLTLGYREVIAQRDTLLLARGECARGHEFHHSTWIDRPTALPAPYLIVNHKQKSSRIQATEGIARRNLLASYIHLHFSSQSAMALNFVNACARWQERI